MCCIKKLLIYVSTACSEKQFSILFEHSKNKPGQAIQKYHRVLAKGFSLNKYKVEMVSLLPLPETECNKICGAVMKENVSGTTFSGDFWEINYTYVNRRGSRLARVMNSIADVKKAILDCYNRNKNYEVTIICDVLNQAASIGAILAAKKIGCDCVGIVTDIPEMLTGATKIETWFNCRIIAKCSKLVLLTQAMNNKVNKKNRPYVVIEGQVDIPGTFQQEMQCVSKYDKFVIMYAGALFERCGIGELINGFIRANIKNSELHLYGYGDMDAYIDKMCQEHPSILYFGTVLNSCAVTEQMKSTILINPRPSSEEYTKYSFPSKNTEYMLSGTPTVTTILPGMPKEYYPFVYLLEDESADGIARKLKELSLMDRSELMDKGARAKDFVLNQKNCKIQAGKIIGELGI